MDYWKEMENRTWIFYFTTFVVGPTCSPDKQTWEKMTLNSLFLSFLFFFNLNSKIKLQKLLKQCLYAGGKKTTHWSKLKLHTHMVLGIVTQKYMLCCVLFQLSVHRTAAFQSNLHIFSEVLWISVGINPRYTCIGLHVNHSQTKQTTLEI